MTFYLRNCCVRFFLLVCFKYRQYSTWTANRANKLQTSVYRFVNINKHIQWKKNIGLCCRLSWRIISLNVSIILSENLKKLYIHLAFSANVVARHRVTKRIKDKKVEEEENDRLINLNNFRRKQQQNIKKNQKTCRH